MITPTYLSHTGTDVKKAQDVPSVREQKKKKTPSGRPIRRSDAPTSV